MPNQRLMALLRRADAAARELARLRHLDTAEVRSLISDTLNAAEGLSGPPNCGRPACTNDVPYGGRGRRPLYCSRSCRDWAARSARQRVERGKE